MEKKPNLLILLICLALSCFFSGWILKTMWAWFIVPLGVMPLSIAHAIGVDSLLTIYRFRYRKRDDNEDWYIPVVGAVFGNLILLAIGALAHLFM
jgi:hypothetical protein